MSCRTLRLLLDLLLAAGGAEEAGRASISHCIGRCGTPQVLEDPLVEAVLAAQQVLQRARNSPDSAPWMMRWS